MDKQVHLGKVYIADTLVAVVDRVRSDDLKLPRGETIGECGNIEEIRPFVVSRVMSLLTDKAPKGVGEALSEWCLGMTFNSVMRSPEKRAELLKEPGGETIENFRRNFPMLMRGHESVESLCTDVARKIEATTDIAPTVRLWFADSDLCVESTGIDLLRLGPKKFAKRIIAVVDDRLNGAGTIEDIDEIYEVYDDAVSLPAQHTLRMGFGMLIAWRMGNSNRGFLIDGDY